jgi:hypothetical protein
MALPSTISLLKSGDFSSPKPHDHRTLAYVGANAADDDDLSSIVYRLGGASGVIVATLTLTYSGGKNNPLTMALTVP